MLSHASLKSVTPKKHHQLQCLVYRTIPSWHCENGIKTLNTFEVVYRINRTVARTR